MHVTQVKGPRLPTDLSTHANQQPAIFVCNKRSRYQFWAESVESTEVGRM